MGSILGAVEFIVGGLEAKRSVCVPGTVVETNGAKAEAEGRTTVSWTITYKDLVAGKNLTQKVTFKAEGLTLKPFTYRPNLANLAARYAKVPGGETDAPKPPAPTTPTTPGGK
jgi:hypothetical protein